MVGSISIFVVLLAGLYFVALGTVSLVRPANANRFLLGFAGSARVHYVELSVRLLVGGALILSAPRMLYSEVFEIFGWLLVAPAIGLLLIPWRWHRLFAQRTVPAVTRYIALIGLASSALGGVILAAVILGS